MNFSFVFKQWLTEEFLGFLKEWTEEGEHLPGLTPKQKQALHLSVPTLAGCHIAGMFCLIYCFFMLIVTYCEIFFNDFMTICNSILT